MLEYWLQPRRIKAVLMDPDIKHWDFYFYIPAPLGLRTHTQRRHRCNLIIKQINLICPQKNIAIYLHTHKRAHLEARAHTHTQRHPKIHISILPCCHSPPYLREKRWEDCELGARGCPWEDPLGFEESPGFKGFNGVEQRAQVVWWWRAGPWPAN